ncbi:MULTISPECIES: hypothetical protein [unclassified Thermoactinomyces]|jgi:hypothetical protein|uniref:hypothetical protein n=1 Tax=unclassified Thermoactinomyces TaxID=2634588 RepID=UPI0018DDC0C0|nr:MULTISPECIES: hypothetical protein [unclassified Thermoactinomyces]MBH8597907.1 hypothetical protein [Thermoactinomyces sp. CICC 10523]MBH8604260.1 hypothetical protein [Thermoactinomyces sp. CICC 10522]
MEENRAKAGKPVSPHKRCDEVNFGAQLADLKLDFYKQTLLLTALLELLIGKGLIERNEFAELVKGLDAEVKAEPGANQNDEHSLY